MSLPAYDDLPPADGGGRSAWGLFGEGDSVGLFNLQTAERVIRAASLIKRGEVFPLNAPIDLVDPPMFGRGAVRRTTLHKVDGTGFDDVLDNFFPQASSQWDSLAHVAFKKGAFYNGVTIDEVVAGHRNTIGHWARRGIAGRAVLLDMETFLGGAGQGFDPGSARSITVDELDGCREAAGITFEEGDILLVNTGFLRWYQDQPRPARSAMADPQRLEAVGLAHQEDMARYLWNAHVAAVASDCPAVEVWPPDWSSSAWPFGFLHHVLIGQFGMALGELWWLDDLAEHCRRDGRFEMFLTSAPLNAPGGIGSPPNALAIK